MSMGEILVIMVIALMMTKPKDLPFIIKKTKNLFLLFKKLKKEVFSFLNNELDLASKSPHNKLENIEKMNFYLDRIIKIEGKYDGNYDLDSLKDKYFAVNNKILHNKKDN